MNRDLAFFTQSGDVALSDATETSSQRSIIAFYDQAGADYLHWSPGFNMHLGFFRWGQNPLDRESMLEQLNREVAQRLHLVSGQPALLIDLGCGAGAVARSIARQFPCVKIKGVTIAGSQLSTANELNREANLQHRIEISRHDFTALPFADRVADGVWAIESACYASGPAKEDLIREMARVLKTGGRFVIADCFVKRPEKKFGFVMRQVYAAACRNWAVTEMPALEPFVAALEKHGFVDVKVEDVSWRVAPTVAHAPFAVASFLFKNWLAGRRLNRQSRNNLKSSLLAFILAFCRTKISYCLVSGRAGSH